MSFRKDFMWGVASSAYQIEGAAFEDGKGASVWDMFTHERGKIREEHTGDIACDHYHRYEEDVALMAELGVKCYRFSICWPRIIPDGIGKVNRAGVDFYNRLIDCLLEHGITPVATLFHWDYPYELEKRGAWLNPDSSDWFAYYAKVCAEEFGDRCKIFYTLNEPQCFLGYGYFAGCNAPGRQWNSYEILPALHNAFLAHGKAVQAMRSVRSDLQFGYAPSSDVCAPATDSPEDIDAARRRYFAVPEDEWMWCVSLWSDPVMLGTYPVNEPFMKNHIHTLPRTWEEDLKTIHQPIDFYGQNIYTQSLWSSDGKGGWQWVRNPMGFSKTSNNWCVSPRCLYWGPKFLYERYKTPIVITENGMGCHDTVSLDGKVHDPNRIDYVHRYLLELKKAAEEGADICGYMYWSVMDNFEWGNGFTDRFGLIYIDYLDGLRRIKKDSFEWYKGVIASNGENL